jgi:hypothetical protein
MEAACVPRDFLALVATADVLALFNEYLSNDHLLLDSKRVVQTVVETKSTSLTKRATAAVR